jgi:bla regulator protein blaR1
MHRISMAVFAFALTGWAQKFEVASIKPTSASDPHRVMFGMQPGGRFSANNVSLKQLMLFSFGIREYQLTGLPSWADSERYDITAKGEDDGSAVPNRMPTQAEMQSRQEKTRAMMQDLLAERFGLKFHRETKDLPIYSLVPAKGGPKLVEKKQEPVVDATGGPSVDGGRGPQPRGQMIRMGRGSITGEQMSTAMLVNQLSSILGRNVVDKTGLTGQYDVKLSWAPDESQGALIPGHEDRPESSGSDGPSVFTALQEQLGLKLESGKGPVEVVVVDKVEKPTQN